LKVSCSFVGFFAQISWSKKVGEVFWELQHNILRMEVASCCQLVENLVASHHWLAWHIWCDVANLRQLLLSFGCRLLDLYLHRFCDDERVLKEVDGTNTAGQCCRDGECVCHHVQVQDGHSLC
jgi:hypothetical protein